MINYSNKEKIVDLFAVLFTYGIEQQYSLDAIGDYIANSEIINQLENNDDSFICSFNNEIFVKEILKLSGLPTLSFNNLVIAEWLAMIYVDIFFQYQKSFYYIFLYLPITDAFSMFDVYHEMDISQTFIYFENRVKKENLLPKLLAKKKITTKQLAVLSGISINTLNGYSKSDAILFGASYKNIKLISQILGVKDNLFLEHLFISIDSGIYLDEQAKAQFTKDAFLYHNTKNILEHVNYCHNASPSYEELLKLINDYVNAQRNNKTVFMVDDVNVYNQKQDNLFLVSDSEVKNLANGKIKSIPPIVREYALIKVGVKPYGNHYKLLIK